MKEFFGFGGFAREAEGFLSWQHLTFVTSLMVCMALLAVLLGVRNRRQSPQVRNRVLVISAIVMDALELFKIIVMCINEKNAMEWVYQLPLYLCSIQLFTLPLAAFFKGSVKEASIDFVCMFGLLGALMGTYGAGQNYAAYPVLSFINVVSGLTHSIAGFASLYILITGMESLRKKNLHNIFMIVLCFSVAAYVFNILLDCNYMFLMRGDGTPYDILYNFVSGNPVLYPLGVVLLFIVYILVFYGVYWKIRGMKNQGKSQSGGNFVQNM